MDEQEQKDNILSTQEEAITEMDSQKTVYDGSFNDESKGYFKIFAIVVFLFLISALTAFGTYYLLGGGSKEDIHSIQNESVEKDILAQEETLENTRFEKYEHPQKLFSFQYPAAWEIYDIKSADTFVGGVNILPSETSAKYAHGFEDLNETNVSGLTPGDITGPFISVGAAFQYDFSQSRDEYKFNLYRDYYIEAITDAGDVEIIRSEEITMGTDPAFLIQYRSKKQDLRGVHIVKLAKGTPSEEISPVLFSIEYAAPEEDYLKETEKVLIKSFSDDLADVI